MSSGLWLLLLLYLLATLLVVALLAVAGGVYVYNRFVRLATRVEAAFSDVDVLLTKRNNLIPNLVETVQGYAGHESGAFAELAALRSRALQADSVAEKAQIEAGVRGQLQSLFAVAENYPTLKADANFRQLQQALQTLEDGIETARHSYNAAVREYNVLLKSFPANLVARLTKRAPCVFFASRDDHERQPPRVDL